MCAASRYAPWLGAGLGAGPAPRRPASHPRLPRRREQGPPWPVTPELYKKLLLPAGFELQNLEAVPPERSHPDRRGKEYLGVWRRAGCEPAVPSFCVA